MTENALIDHDYLLRVCQRKCFWCGKYCNKSFEQLKQCAIEIEKEASLARN